jgi:hypothetical protein
LNFPDPFEICHSLFAAKAELYLRVKNADNVRRIATFRSGYQLCSKGEERLIEPSLVDRLYEAFLSDNSRDQDQDKGRAR